MRDDGALSTRARHCMIHGGASAGPIPKLEYVVVYPNIYGEGALFAFSGMDGPTSHERMCVGSLLGDAVGMRFRGAGMGDCKRREVEMRIHHPGVTIGGYDRGRSIAAGDVIDLVSGCSRILLVAAAHGVIRGRVEGEETVIELTGPAKGGVLVSGGRQVAWRGVRCALRVSGKGDFAVALRGAMEGDAVAAAKKALRQHIEPMRARRLAFFENVPRHDDPAVAGVIAKAASVLRVNVESPQGDIPCRWTTPDRYPHRHMWLWDSAFHALGWKHIDRTVAVDAIAAVLAKQLDDGMIPITMMPRRCEGRWSQPPILAWSAEHVLGTERDAKDVWTDFYPKLAGYVRWFFENRKGAGRGLFGWLKEEGSRNCRCGESGIDNGVQFDRPGQDDHIDLCSYLTREAATLCRVARLLGRRREAAEWESTRKRIAGEVNRALWSEKHGLYFDRAGSGSHIALGTATCFLPLYAGIPSATRAKRLVASLRGEAFWRPLPVPSLGATAKGYSKNMWRGPVWMNHNWLIVEGLIRYGHEAEARAIAGRSVAEIVRWYERIGVLMEYYDAEADWDPRYLHRKGDTGSGRAVIRDYGWTAACLIAFAML